MIPDYLVSFDTGFLPSEETDVLIVGGGIAGMRAALDLATARAVLIRKDGIEESCTCQAQGGIACPGRAGDSIEAHVADTLAAGGGIADRAAVESILGEGVERVKELIAWGFRFDTQRGKLRLGREGGHAAPRILHAGGDITGRRLASFLERRVQDTPDIRVRSNLFLVDLLAFEDTVLGAVCLDTASGSLAVIRAGAVIIASGGAGQLFQETTNPGSITGDGQAAAFRRGVELTDLEFYQFHPTTLYLAGAPRFLISEAVRGEGGILRNAAGEAFMSRYAKSAELAPRDIVALAIIDQMRTTSSNCVFLDLTHVGQSFLRRRFPHITSYCRFYGLNLARDWIPVRPAAHYWMGGIRTNLRGETNLRNLYACGEAACTGMHGANRLASNSLLEGLVMGARTASRVRERGARPARLPAIRYRFPQKADILIDRDDLRRSVRSLMWRNVGISRDAAGLREALARFRSWESYAFLKEFHEAAGFESQNLLVLAGLTARAAMARAESRGAHYRADRPGQEGPATRIIHRGRSMRRA